MLSLYSMFCLESANNFSAAKTNVYLFIFSFLNIMWALMGIIGWFPIWSYTDLIDITSDFYIPLCTAGCMIYPTCAGIHSCITSYSQNNPFCIWQSCLFYLFADLVPNWPVPNLFVVELGNTGLFYSTKWRPWYKVFHLSHQPSGRDFNRWHSPHETKLCL